MENGNENSFALKRYIEKIKFSPIPEPNKDALQKYIETKSKYEAILLSMRNNLPSAIDVTNGNPLWP